jgi:cytochrome c biogenesis protein CcmG/thiol:disulfide interchange protein DsbE
MMKTISFFGTLLVAMLMLGASAPATRQLPNLTIADLQGKPVNILEYTKKNTLTVLSFWATWCSPCKRELDAIADLYPEWQEKLGVELVAITIDNARALSQVKPIIEEKSWEYVFLVDSKQELQQALGFQAIPQTFIVDSEGTILYQHEGYNPGDELELEKKLTELAGK